MSASRGARARAQLLAQDREGTLDAGRTAGGQRPVGGLAEEDAARPERQGDGDVEARPDAAVDPDLGPSGDRVDDLAEDVGRRRDPVELARAVVADDERVGAVLDGEARVLGGQDPLQDERQR